MGRVVVVTFFVTLGAVTGLVGCAVVPWVLTVVVGVAFDVVMDVVTTTSKKDEKRINKEKTTNA
jgi:hypothetical protein